MQALIHERESALQSRLLLAALIAFNSVLNRRSERRWRLFPYKNPKEQGSGRTLAMTLQAGGVQGNGRMSAKMAPGWQARWSSRVYSYRLV